MGLINSHLRNATEPERRHAIQTLLTHQYLYRDPWHLAELKARECERRRCLDALGALKTRFARNEVTQEVPEHLTGSPSLTLPHLDRRPLPLFRLSPEWLLFSIERHPAGGTGMIVEQFWLYNKQERRLRLLQAGRRPFRVDNPPTMVQAPGGEWGRPSTRLKEEFEGLIREILSEEALRDYQRGTHYQHDDLLSSPPEEVVAEAAAICGIDFRLVDAANRAATERRIARELGPQPSRPPSVGIDPHHFYITFATDGPAAGPVTGGVEAPQPAESEYPAVYDSRKAQGIEGR